MKTNRQIIEQDAQNKMFDSVYGLTNEEQVIRNEELKKNPVPFTYAIGGDAYIKYVVGFERNGRTLLYKSDGKYAEIEKMTWKTGKREGELDRYTTRSGWIYFSQTFTRRDMDR